MSATGSGPVSPPADAKAIPWTWDPTVPAGNEVMLDWLPACHFAFHQRADGAAELRAERPVGVPAWVHAIPAGVADSASLAFHEGRLYALLYRARVTGAILWSLDATTGTRDFEVRLEGIGPLHHSKYSNRAQLRFIGDSPVAFGDESGGRYVEVRDPTDGHLISNRVDRA